MVAVFRRSLVATAALLCLAGGGPAAEGPRGRVVALAFTSDHGLIRQSTGERSPAVQWRAEPPRNAPVTHTGGRSARVAVEVLIEAEGVSPGTAYRLEGLSEEPALCFRHDGAWPRGETVRMELRSSGTLGRAVRRIRRSVRWRLTLAPGSAGAEVVALDTTGPHVIYVTLGTPKDTDDPVSAVTQPRMALAVERVASAMACVGERASPPRLVHELMSQNGRYYLPNRHYPRRRAWDVPESWELEPPGASCISIVDFVILLCKMVGLEGRVALAAYHARPDDPLRAVPGGLGDSPLYRQGPFGETWQLFLVDEHNTNNGHEGGAGGMNYYEAVLAYEWRGRRYLYPGGTDYVFDRPENVLKIFRTLAWARWDPGAGDWVVTEVVQTYTRTKRDYPPDVRLP